jgi:hypothetical protein
MGPDLRLQQRVLDRFELVIGIGEPDEGTACVMSLVAHLAGEGHTDRPRSATSPSRSTTTCRARRGNA